MCLTESGDIKDTRTRDPGSAFLGMLPWWEIRTKLMSQKSSWALAGAFPATADRRVAEPWRRRFLSPPQTLLTGPGP